MGATAFAVRRHTYLDSVFLMRVARALEAKPGVAAVAALMATPANKGLLAEAGFAGPDVDAAQPDDLIVGVAASTLSFAEAAVSSLDGLLADPAAAGAPSRAATWDEAAASLPDANLAAISVPGEHAAAEVERALERGLHVFCFSSNVALDDEIRLKRLAESRGLLLMGPDCGTSIIAGVGLGFSNAVRRGPVGITGGSGTGIQAISCLIDAGGSGVSHAIGSGSHDLNDAVGGVTTFAALHALADDANTRVIVVVSKTPGPATRKRLEQYIAGSSKPVVTCFLGSGEVGSAGTFAEAAAQALRLVEADVRTNGAPLATPPHVSGRAIGLFAGGSLRFEALRVLERAGIRPDRYELIDMGSEELTSGRAHPMIDGRLRAERVLAAAGDPSVELLLLDFVLGRGASPDPAGDLIPAIDEARRRAGRRLVVVASLIGTERDPQGLQRQRAALSDAGVVVLPTSAAAAAYVAGALL